MASPRSRMLMPSAPRKQGIRVPIQPIAGIWQSQSNQEDEACALNAAYDDGWMKNLTPAKPVVVATRFEPKRNHPEQPQKEKHEEPYNHKQEEPQQQPQRDSSRNELERLHRENQFLKQKLNEANFQHEQQIWLLNEQLQQIRVERDQSLQRMNDELQHWKKAHADAVENARRARGDCQTQMAETPRAETSTCERWPNEALTFSVNTLSSPAQCKSVVYSAAPSVLSPSRSLQNQSTQLKTHLVNVASVVVSNGHATPMKIAPQNPYQWRNTPLPSLGLLSTQTYSAPPPTPCKTSPFVSSNNEQYSAPPPNQTVGTSLKLERPVLVEVGQSNQPTLDKKPSGSLISYCTDFLAASLTPVITAAASPLANAKVAPAWYWFSKGSKGNNNGVVMPDEFDPEVGRVQINTPAAFDGNQPNPTPRNFPSPAPYQRSKQAAVLPLHAMASY